MIWQLTCSSKKLISFFQHLLSPQSYISTISFFLRFSQALHLHGLQMQATGKNLPGAKSGIMKFLDKVILSAWNKNLTDGVVKDLPKSQRRKLSLFFPMGFDNLPESMRALCFLFFLFLFFFFPNGHFNSGFPVHFFLLCI